MLETKQKYTARWKTHLKDFNDKQNIIADMALDLLKDKPKDNVVTDGEWLRVNHPQVNERYDRLLKYFGLL